MPVKASPEAVPLPQTLAGNVVSSPRMNVGDLAGHPTPSTFSANIKPRQSLLRPDYLRQVCASAHSCSLVPITGFPVLSSLPCPMGFFMGLAQEDEVDSCEQPYANYD